MSTRRLTMIAMLTALTCIVGPLTLPIGPVPASLTSAVLLLTALLLGARQASLVCTVYLLIGLTGLPVLSGFTGGAARLLGPTGGYIVGYLPMTAIAGAVCSRTERKLSRCAGMALGTLILYALGTAWYCMQSGVSVAAALAVCVWPFLPVDAVKIGAVLIGGSAVKARLTKAGLLR